MFIVNAVIVEMLLKLWSLLSSCCRSVIWRLITTS